MGPEALSWTSNNDDWFDCAVAQRVHGPSPTERPILFDGAQLDSSDRRLRSLLRPECGRASRRVLHPLDEGAWSAGGSRSRSFQPRGMETLHASWEVRKSIACLVARGRYNDLWHP